VSEFVRARGGRLYVWTSLHRCCTGQLRLLETGTEAPPGAARRFRAVDVGGYELSVDLGGAPLPDELVLELRGRGKEVAAFWSGQAWVG